MTTDSEQRVEAWLPVAPMDGCTFSGYEVSDKGRARSIDRKQGNRQLRGKMLATRPHDDGYVLVTIRCDSTEPDHKRAHTFTMHKVVLYTFAGAPAPGQEACHSPRGPAFNWWPEGVRWDGKKGNHQDMVAAGTAVVPASFPCRNAPACGNMVRNEGRRCFSCVQQVGVDVAGMLRSGHTIEEAAARFGNSPDWLFRLAVEHGGFAGTLAEVRAVRHEPCRCSACVAITPSARNPLIRAFATLRNRSRSASR